MLLKTNIYLSAPPDWNNWTYCMKIVSDTGQHLPFRWNIRWMKRDIVTKIRAGRTRCAKGSSSNYIHIEAGTSQEQQGNTENLAKPVSFHVFLSLSKSSHFQLWLSDWRCPVKKWQEKQNSCANYVKLLPSVIIWRHVIGVPNWSLSSLV